MRTTTPNDHVLEVIQQVETAEPLAQRKLEALRRLLDAPDVLNKSDAARVYGWSRPTFYKRLSTDTTLSAICRTFSESGARAEEYFNKVEVANDIRNRWSDVSPAGEVTEAERYAER